MVSVFPDFKTPPVTEVVCGITFKKIRGFKAPHFGVFWNKIRSEYPSCQHAAPLGFPPPISGEPDEGFPFIMPRVWFISEDETSLIQLQENRFLCNWRKMEGKGNYPRYETIIESFKKNLNLFRDFLKDENLSELEINECELTYVNHILKNEGWKSVGKLHELLPDLLCWQSDTKKLLPDPDALLSRFSFGLPKDKGKLDVNIKKGIRKKDNVPLFEVDLTCRGISSERTPEDIWEWFDLAHEWIVFGFVDLTSAEVQKTIWGRIK